MIHCMQIHMQLQGIAIVKLCLHQYRLTFNCLTISPKHFKKYSKSQTFEKHSLFKNSNIPHPQNKPFKHSLRTETWLKHTPDVPHPPCCSYSTVCFGNYFIFSGFKFVSF